MSRGPNAGHIIVKGSKTKGEPEQNMKSVSRFFMPVDKGSAKPAFCYPKHRQDLKEEVRGMEKALEDGNVSSERKMKYKMDLKEKKTRLDEILESGANAKKIIAEDKDYWVKRRLACEELIAKGTPTRKDVKNRVVNPHAILRREKKEGLENIKREYQIISSAMGEESNVSFLQKDS